MESKTKKQFLIILVLTVLFGIIVFFLAKFIDTNVSETSALRHEIDEQTRVTSNFEPQTETVSLINQYSDDLNNTLPTSENLIDILNQLEIIGTISGVEISIQIEEGTIGKETIELETSHSTEDILENSEAPSPTGAPQDASPEEIADQIKKQQEQETEGSTPDKVNITYIEISIILKGSYEQIRSYINLLQDSKYFFNIKEISLTKRENVGIEASLQIRAFLYEN